MFPPSFMTMQKIIFLDLSSNKELDSQKLVNQTTIKKENHQKLQGTRQFTNFEQNFLEQAVFEDLPRCAEGPCTRVS